MLAQFLKFIIRIGIRLYYAEVRVNNKHHLNPENQPLIIIANHPNTLIDAWVIGMLCKQPIYFMAKATFFDSKLKKKLLSALNMIPINRKSEAKTKGVSNQDSLNACYQILGEGKTLVVFPEGTSYKERVLRELKTGTARIALETEKLHEGKLNLQVVAVGINYSQSEKFRSNILIDIDKPQDIKEYYELYLKDKKEAVVQLTNDFRQRLERVLVTTETKEEEQLIEDVYNILNTKYIPSDDKGVQREVKELKEIKKHLDEQRLLQPWKIEEIRKKVRSIHWKLNKMKIRADFLDRKFRSLLFFRQLLTSLLFVVFALPLAFFGLVHNYGQYVFTDWLVPKISKDIEYYAPLAILIGFVIYPLTYFAFLCLAYHYFDFHWLGLLIYFVSMPLTGIFAYWFFKYLKHISYKWRYMLLMMDHKNMIKEIQEERQMLKVLIFE